MLYDLKQFEVRAGRPVKLEFVNPDAISHNLVIIRPGTEEAVGLEVNRMIADPKQIEIGQYIPETDAILFHTEMVPPTPAKPFVLSPRKNRATIRTSALSWSLDDYEGCNGGEVMDLKKGTDNKKAALEINRSLPQGGYQSFSPAGLTGHKVERSMPLVGHCQ